MLLLAPCALGPACTQADAVCALVCDCEHCSDAVEDVQCTLWNGNQEVAETYGCAEEWSEYAGCVESEGRCEEDDARYTTTEAGSCSGSADSGFPCGTSADCAAQGFTGGCEAGTCRYRTCSGADGGSFCQRDEDCPGARDLCEEEETRLEECIARESDDPSARLVGIID
jgi:hypothetical protein